MTDQPTVARSRTPAVIWIGVIAVTAAVGGLIAVADRPPDTSPRSTAETFLPPDGAASLLEYQDGSRWVIESAHTTGVLFLLQQPPASANHQLDRMNTAQIEATQSRFWRQTWTDVAGERDQITELYELDDDGVRLLALTGGPNGFSYSPGLLVLPSDVSDGATWSSSGEAFPEGLLEYTATGSATARDDGCLTVDTTLTYTDPNDNDAVYFDSTETDVWCPGRGLVDATFSSDGEPGGASARALANGELPATDTDPVALDFSDYADWSPRELTLTSVDPVFGESSLLTTTDSTSATTPSGIAVFNTGVDVAAYRVDGTTATRDWLARPGGSILWLTTIGETVLVATTERQLVAYDSSGLRLWAVGFADVLGARPATDGSGGALVQVLNGDLVRLDLDDGSELWRARLGDDAEVTPTVDDGHVYAADRAGGLYSFALDTGDREWTGTVANPAVLAATNGRVFVASVDGSLEVWDATTRALAWSVTIPGIPDALAVTSSRVVVQSDETTVAYDHGGTRQWTTAAGDGLATDGTRILVVGDGTASLVDDDKTELASWDVEQESLAFSRRLVLAPSGFWIVGSDFRVQAVGAP